MLFHTRTTSPDAQGFLSGFAKALELARSNGTHQVLFKVQSLTSLDGVVADALGEDFAKSFSKKRTAMFGKVEFFLETEKIKSTFGNGVAFAPFVSEKLLSAVHQDDRVNGSVYVPGTSSELDSYEQEYTDSTAL